MSHPRFYPLFVFILLGALLISDISQAQQIPADQCAAPSDSVESDSIPMEFYPSQHRSPQSCSSVDIRARMPQVRNQGETGWCYAFAAADLLSFHTGEPVSAIDLAVRTQARLGTAEHRASLRQRGPECYLPLADADTGGEVADAMTTAIQHGGYCSEADIPATENFVEHIKTLENLRRRTGTIRRTSPEARQALASLFPNRDVDQMADIFARSRVQDWRVYQDLARRACANNRKPVRNPPQIRSIETTSSAEKQRAQRVMDRLLTQGQPVAYSAYFVFQGDSVFMDRYRSSDAHAMTIVGREWNPRTGACEYIVRNSYGTGCNYDWQQNGRTISESPYRCENGHIWVPESVLMSAMMQVDWIDGRGSPTRPAPAPRPRPTSGPANQQLQ